MSLIRMESCELTGIVGEKWTAFEGASFNQIFDGKTCWVFPQHNKGAQVALSASEQDDVIIAGVRSSWDRVGDANEFNIQFGSHIEIQPSGTGTIGAYRAGTLVAQSDPAVWEPDTWFYLEVKVRVHETEGYVVMRVNGTEVCNTTNIDTQNGGTAVIASMAFGSPGGSQVTRVRDIIIMNEQGSDFNDFIGPVLVQARTPNGAGGVTEWTPNAGANYEAVDDSPTNDGDTTYVESSVAGNRDTYAVTDFDLAGDPIAVQVYATARYETSPLNIATCLRRSATNIDGVAVAPGGSYGTRAGTIWTTDPIVAGAWTLANLNATEFGILSVTP